MKALLAALCVAVLLVGCSSKPEPQIAGLCSLTTLPHSTPSERAVVRQEAKVRMARITHFAATKANKDIAIAVLHLEALGYGLPTGVPSPLASLIESQPPPPGLATFDEALDQLKRACA